jgi:tetratricopeptide (TPR) repeat protein
MDYFVEECQGRDLASLSPSDRVMFHTAMASRLKREDQLPEALVHARAAVAEAEWLPEAWKLIGMLELELGHPEKASAALERLLSAEFESSPAARAQQRDYSDDSIDRLNRPPLYALLAESYAAQGRWEQAARAMQQAARESGEVALVATYRSNEASAWERAGRIAEARAAWDEVLRLEPSHPDAARERARLEAVGRPQP